MERIKIKELCDKAGEKVKIAGWVDNRRDHGKLIFIDLRDASGKVQMVALPNHEEASKVAGTLRSEWVVEILGNVNARPEKMVNDKEPNGSVEIEITDIKVLSEAEELPFDLYADLNLDTYLDYLPLTLRKPENKEVFEVQAEIMTVAREYLNSEDFTEFQSPKILGNDAEGGASVFRLEYFKGQMASLAQSPQLYKQIMVGIFERVYTFGNVFRAEKHSTSRHLNEYTSMDVELGFIKDHHDVMKVSSGLVKAIVDRINEKFADVYERREVEPPKIGDHIPHMKLREAQAILKKEYDEDLDENAPDLEPQHERWICDYVKREMDSDFVFITHYPVEKTAMYAHEDDDDPGFTKYFDLLFRGVEIQSGGQRYHEPDRLIKSIERKGLDPEGFNFYMQAFRYGMPPHGGFAMGLERLTEKFLGIDNVKKATLFPREINRIDTLLTKVEGQKDAEED